MPNNFLIILLLLSPAIVYSQNERIEYTKNQSQYIDSNIDNFQKAEYSDINVYKDLNSESYSFESTIIYRLAMINMIKYFEKNELVKMELLFSGDKQNLHSEYYYDENGLFYVFKELTEFENPKWSDSFDPDERVSQEKQYYFKASKMILWVDRYGNKLDSRTAEYNKTEEQVYLDSQLYKNYAEN